MDNRSYRWHYKFLHGVPHFAISIALKSGDEIVSGLIYDPIKDEMFYAEKESGAFFNNQRIRVSKKESLIAVCLLQAVCQKMRLIYL